MGTPLYGTNIIAPVMPGSTDDVFPTHESLYGKGGHRTVQTLAERNAIPPERREERMIVGVIDEAKDYMLVGGILDANWIEYSASMSSAVSWPEYEAGEALSGQRLVMSDSSGLLWYASNASLSDANCILGITTGAISLGSVGPVQTYGDISEPSWFWTPKSPLYLSTAGNMTQTPPTSGVLLKVGYAVTAQRIFVDIDSPIERS